MKQLINNLPEEILHNGNIDRDYLKDYIVENISNETAEIMRFLMTLIGGEHYEYSNFASCYFTTTNGSKFRIATHRSNNNTAWNNEIIIYENSIEHTAENVVQELFDAMGNFIF